MNFRLLLLFNLILLLPLIAVAQQKEQSVNFGLGYNIVDFTKYNKSNDALVGKVSYQRKWLEVGLTAGYMKNTHYDRNYYFGRETMYDKFFRFGLFSNFRILNLDRHKINLGFHYGRFVLLEHYYYSDFWGQISEISCSGNDCPVVPDYTVDFDFRTKYNWQFGIHLAYQFRIWDQLFISPRFDFERLNGTEAIDFYGTYFTASWFAFSPTLSLEYHLPLTKKKPAE